MSVTDTSVTGMFEVHSMMAAEEFDNVHNHPFWRFLKSLAKSDGGLARLEAAMFDPAHAKRDTSHYAARFCAERADEDRYARILERVLLEHPVEDRRVVAAEGLGNAGRYDALERAYSTDGSAYAVTEIAGHLVRRDARNTIPPGVENSVRAVDAIFNNLWGNDGNDTLYWRLEDHLNDAAEIIGFERMIRIVHMIMTHEMTPREYSAAAHRKIRKHGGDYISDRISGMMARRLVDSIMRGKRTAARGDVETAVADYFKKYL